MMTTTLSIDVGIAPVGMIPADVPMAATLAENMQDGAAFQEAVAKFQAAMAAPQGAEAGVWGAQKSVLARSDEALLSQGTPATAETLKAVVAENVRIAAELPKTVELPKTAEIPVATAETPVATPETLKAVVAENMRIAAELQKPVEIPIATAEKIAPSASEAGGSETVAPQTAELPVLQAAPMAVSVESAAAQQVVADVKVAAVDAASARTQILVDAVEAVCDAILVTPGLVRGEGEMLIRLKPDVLSGTEIRLSVKGKAMTVAFIPATTEVSTLIEQNLSQFQQHLSGRIHNYQIAARIKGKELKG